MPEKLFNKIIAELSALRYNHLLKLQRYNEPLALDLIYNRIRYARKNLKQAVIGLHTNGDFLTARKLQRLQNNGLDFLIISRYIEFSGSAEGQLKRAKEHCLKYLKNLGLPGVPAYNYGDIITYRIPMRTINVLISVPDASRQWCDRGGIIQKYSARPRVSPCLSPFKRLFIDWNGAVLPCCNLRGDIPSHTPYIIGNAAESSLQDIYFSNTSNSVRSNLAGFHPKEGACKTCRSEVFPDHQAARRMIREALKELKPRVPNIHCAQKKDARPALYD